MDYTDRLRRLALNDITFDDSLARPSGLELDELDPKMLALVRIAALIAIDAPEPSFGTQADAAVAQGATAGEIVDVLVGVLPILGVPRVVAAAPKLALALGYDIDATL